MKIFLYFCLVLCLVSLLLFVDYSIKNEKKLDTVDEIIAILKEENINLTLHKKGVYITGTHDYSSYIINGERNTQIVMHIFRSKKEVEHEIKRRTRVKKMADGDFPPLYSYKNVIIGYWGAVVTSEEKPDTYKEALEKHFTFREY